MTDQITLEEALELVTFYHTDVRGWQVRAVNGNVDGTVLGNIDGNVGGNIWGDVRGNVFGYIRGDVGGIVKGKINGRSWESVETPEEKFQRLIAESGNQELINTFNQLEDN